MRKQRGLVILACIALAVTALGAVLLVWRGPWWLDGKYLSDKELRAGSSALVTGFRTSVVQLFAVFGAGVALLFTAFNYRLTQRGQVTERFTKALERLGSTELYVRIGGLLALEQIVQDAPGQAGHATQVLKAFVRDRASRVPAPRPALARSARIAAARRAARNGETPPPIPSARRRPDADVQQVVDTLVGPKVYEHPDDDIHEWEGGREHTEGRSINFSDLDLAGADFHRADLCGVRLDGADLTQATMTKCYLQWASLEGADLTGASMYGANLRHARMRDANLTDAFIDGADLQNAHELTVQQVLVADVTSRTSLPSRIAQHPDVIARMAEVEKRIDQEFDERTDEAKGLRSSD
ncbi:pentapeptide repeat-containing protein [Streptomyces sp. MS2.AVA.5]|uniref:Pentapeptide repeat-containing protein n=1 Tax=Streptomyces achmelvichensis TaxID=3134111 RepID=A0ACC6Q5R6_9ACTN